MPRFKGGASGLSPLAIQLVPGGPSDPPTGVCKVVGWSASVETQLGIATVVSRPVITRPSLLGTSPGTSPTNIIGITNPAAVSNSELLTAYGTPPSFPSVSPYTVFAPYSVQWAAGSGEEAMLVLPGSGILLYALAGSNAAWNGQLEWDEV